MQTVRSLPPELQRLIDEYNSLREDAGYVNPYIEPEFDGPRLVRRNYRDSDLSYREFEDREKMIKDKYKEIVDLGRKLVSEGKIEPVSNPRMGKPDTYIYDRVYEYPENPIRGKTYYMSASMPEAPMFKDKREMGQIVYYYRPEELKTIKPLKAGRQELPARELQESVPMDMPQVQKQLIMSANQRMRTGQEPGYYIIREEGKRPVMRPVEEEERQYYRTQNRIGR
tara:strand:- start:2685 stop:3362 length:678 start_codon:yes stop_codon:yes gene_type:complete